MRNHGKFTAVKTCHWRNYSVWLMSHSTVPVFEASKHYGHKSVHKGGVHHGNANYPTPVLEGKEAVDFLNRIAKEQSEKVKLTPPPRLHEVHEQVKKDVQRRKK